MKKSFSPLISILILLAFLAKPEISLSGARKGLLLWANVVLPTLLPFMICATAVVALGGLPLLIRPFHPVLSQIFGFSKAGSFVFLTGLLCGYPMGAKTTGEFLEWGMITEKEGQYLLAVSNHPSPMFLLGYVMTALGGQNLPLLLLSIYLPLFPLSWAARTFYGCSKGRSALSSSGKASENRQLSTHGSFDQSMMGSFEVIEKIGGYIMLFSIGAEFIKIMSPFSPSFNAILLGFTEITTGIHQLSLVMNGSRLRLWVVAATVFGGLSGIFQTKSVLFRSMKHKKAGLSIRHYVIWKLIHGCLSVLTLILLSLLPLPWQAPLP